MSKGNAYLNHTTAQLDEAIEKVLSGELDVPLQSKTVTPNTTQQIVVPDSAYKGLSQVTVKAIPQTYTDDVYNQGYTAGLEDATPTLQSKTVTPSTAQQTVSPDSGYDGLSEVVVKAIPQSYTDTVYNQGYSAGYDAAKPYKTELSYLQSSGLQYFNLGFKANQNTRIVVDVDITAASAERAIFGARTASKNNAFCVWTAPNNNGYQSDYGTQMATPVGSNSTGRHTIDRNKNVLTVDGTVVHTHTASTFQTAYDLYLLQVNNAGSILSGYPFSGKLYSCQVYDNGTLIHDYVPVLDFDDVPCLYDKVKRERIYNAGTGNFTYPRDLPSGYTQREYIQSSGTQYVDTAFTPNNNTRVVMDVEFISTPSGTSSLFGTRASASSKNYSLLWASSKLRSDYNTQYSQTWSVTATSRRVIDKDKETTTIDGTSQSYTNASFQAPCSLTLLASNNNGTVQWNATAKVYSCQIYDNGVLVRDFVPCTNNSGTAGLYDLVSNQFYGNAGTGAFTYA